MDTEFTGLDKAEPKLISIALVPADGRNEFYAEVEIGDGWNEFDCTPFVRAEVLPLLWGGKWQVSRTELRQGLVAWIAARQRFCEIATDSEIDIAFLKSVLTGTPVNIAPGVVQQQMLNWPANLAQRFVDLREMIDTKVFDHAAQAYYAPDRRPHHALHDARANRCGWLSFLAARKPTNRIG